MALYMLYGSKLDMRDWMIAEAVDFAERAQGGEFWFDYLADTGDGQEATYSVAYLCLSDLRLPINAELGTLLGVGTVAATTGEEQLHRGQFLLMGGDTAYHIADYATLATRLQTPFRRAALQLGINDSSERRPLFGLPGNHDYYDVLDGFGRQFHQPLYPDGSARNAKTGPAFPPPLLQLPGFRRCQTASYLALKLPFDWSLWSVDCELGRVDIRQQKFFRELGVPDRLIVATSKPTTALGRKASPESAHAFEDLGLPQAFRDEELPPGRCRLDLSGDMHHYARYWGSAEGRDAPAPSKRNYASVVCGLGGAFLHPTHEPSREIKAQMLYPRVRDSRRVLAKALLNPITIFGGGLAWLLALIAALVIYGATLAPATRQWIEPLFSGLAAIAPCFLTELPARQEMAAPTAAQLGFSGLTVLLSIGSFLLLGLWLIADRALLLGHRSGRLLRGRLLQLGTWAVASASGAAFIASLFSLAPNSLPTIGFAATLLSAFVWSGLAISVAVRYREWLFRYIRHRDVVGTDYLPVAALLLVAVFVPNAALWRLGDPHSVTAAAQALLFLSLVSGLLVALVAFAVVVGAGGHQPRGKIGFLFLGAYHALVQLILPTAVVRMGNTESVIAIALVSALLAGLGHVFHRKGWRFALLGTWLTQGLGVLFLVILFPAIPGFSPPLSSRMSGLASSVVAGVVGMIMGSVSLGWYLLVSLSFGGHANEAGAAARLDAFRGFIRFRLNSAGLTGYAIGIEKPNRDGAELSPVLIDRFTVQPYAAVAPLEPVARG